MVKIDTWGLPTNVAGEPRMETTDTNYLSQSNKISINDYTSNSGVWLSNVSLTNNAVNTTPLDISTLGGNLNSSSAVKKVFFHGFCSMSVLSDAITIYYSNDGVNFNLGGSYRPTLNRIDNKYHFVFTLDAFTSKIYIGNNNSSGNSITALTINYTFLK